MTAHIRDDSVAEAFLPSRSAFERLHPMSPPTGLHFPDGSFLVFHETVHYGYRDQEVTEPTIYRTRYSYHYQRPQDRFYFRYDHHPDIGDPETHPLHHLHSAGWGEGATQFQDVPRYPVAEVTLLEVLRLIRVSFC
jgi:hypothetical protein